jgi:hypothetical protein
MDYDAVEDMSRAFSESARRLEDMAGVIRQIADLFDDGALVSQQGQRWVASLQSRLIPLLNNGGQSFEEIARDLMGAVRDLRDGDVEARSRFSG